MNPESLLIRAAEALNQSNWDEAEACFLKAIALAPGFAEAHRRFADFLLDQHRPEEALQHLQRYRELNPGDLRVCLALVDACIATGAPGDAIELLKSALETDPANPMYLLPLAYILTQLGQVPEAIHTWRILLNNDQYSQEAHLRLGMMLYQQRDFSGALQHLRSAVAMAPGDLSAGAQLGFSLAETGYISEAQRLAARLIHQHPQAELAHMLDGFVAIQQARIKEGIDAYKRALKINPNATSAISNICQGSMYADFLDAEAVTALHVEMSRKHNEQQAVQLVQPRLARTGRRIRVGYLSADFRSHPVGFFLQPILQNHDHTEFEVFGYGTGVEPDDTGQELISQLDHWRYCSAMTDDELAALIRTDQLDILVDAGGYTANNRMQVLARRVAPVQASYLAYPCTTGMDQMDYCLGDMNLMQQGSAPLYSERQIKLSGSFLCFTPRPSTPPVAALPLFENGCVTFGSFNNLSKVSDRCIRLWARVLRAVAGSRLLLKAQALVDAGTRELTWSRFEAHGIKRGEVLLEGPTTPVTAFLKEYSRVDVALDSVPYCGGTTSCDALWMGVPVVSLAGRHFYERMGSSILRALGRPEWCSDNEESYVATALSLASDAARLSGIRSGLREMMSASPLCNARAMTLEMERAFRIMLN